MATRPTAPRRRGRELFVAAAALIFTFIVGRAVIIALNLSSWYSEMPLLLGLYLGSYLVLARAFDLLVRR
jgi:hypothetical protein